MFYLCIYLNTIAGVSWRENESTFLTFETRWHCRSERVSITCKELSVLCIGDIWFLFFFCRPIEKLRYTSNMKKQIGMVRAGHLGKSDLCFYANFRGFMVYYTSWILQVPITNYKSCLASLCALNILFSFVYITPKERWNAVPTIFLQCTNYFAKSWTEELYFCNYVAWGHLQKKVGISWLTQCEMTMEGPGPTNFSTQWPCLTRYGKGGIFS